MTTTADWSTANQRDLSRELQRVRVRLERHRDRLRNAPQDTVQGDERAEGDVKDSDVGDATEVALQRVVRRFNLSDFERDVLLLCAGMELDSRVGELVAELQGQGARSAPTFALALAVLADPHWSALTPAAPLRAWRLLELTGAGVSTAALCIDERVLHELAGVSELDERLHGFLEPVSVNAAALPLDASVAEALARHFSNMELPPRRAQLTSGDARTRDAIMGHVGALRNSPVFRLRASEFPVGPGERNQLARLVARELLLRDGILLLELAEPSDEPRVHALLASEQMQQIALVFSAAEPLRSVSAAVARFDVGDDSAADRRRVWQQALGARAEALNGSLSRVTAQFALDRPSIEAVVASLPAADDDAESTGRALWNSCRVMARARMDGLAQRIDARATWEDLVLPDATKAVLRTIVAQVRLRHRVYEEWGFAEQSARGLGIAALFAGASGTGKTMATEVIARDLQLDLYRIDLSSVVSKYIGETEKNLAQLFATAEGSGAVLLFDEADALFGKRSEVKDSHDRYANIETSYLLQRMESYRGLSILTTNMRSALDPAFTRRIRFLVTFPFPDASLREAIWRGAFPSRVPVQGLEWQRLAQLNASGGQIHNIAMSAAFQAADSDAPVSMSHLAAAAHAELAKGERVPSGAELRGWS